MWYNTRHENTHFCPTFNRGRTAPSPGRTAFVRCLCDAPLPDLESIGTRRTSPSDCAPTGLRRPNCTQCDPRVQHGGAARASRKVPAPPSPPHHLLPGRVLPPAQPPPSQSPPPPLNPPPLHP